MQVFLHKLAGYRIANQECNSLVTGQKLGEILVKMRITFSNCSEFPTTQSQPSADQDAPRCTPVHHWVFGKVCLPAFVCL